ncbi:GNAT family N-acetyltransferase [Nocardia sp. NPDC024068]|uniref:GNAT family N-acetyltransferase n=1 Tax=Nocardia sp. NPDC024068 TaxID=3157197 RepID=UPI0033C7BAC2
MTARHRSTADSGPRSPVRPAGPGDIARIVEIRAKVAAEGRWIGAEGPLDTAEAAARLRDALADEKFGVFVAEIDGMVCGSATVRFTGRGVTEFGMMLTSDQRGRGLGGDLLTRVIDWSREHGAHKIALQVWPHNARALALYARAGFEVEGVLRAHYPRRNGELWDAVVMGLPLSEAARRRGPR